LEKVKEKRSVGRPAMGETRKISVTLPPHVWKKIEKIKGDMTMSAFFRAVLLASDYDWRD
jgi:hypothetical protein